MNLSFTKKPGPTHHAIHSDRQYYHNHKRFWLETTAPARMGRYRRPFHIPDKPFLPERTGQKSACILSRSKRTTIPKNETMIQHSLKPEIMGTRTGYVIRFTCPVCFSENAIISKNPRDHFRDTRDARCKQCRKRCTVLTPGTNDKPALPYVQSYFECTKLQ